MSPCSIGTCPLSIITVPPIAVFEILPPEDTMSRILAWSSARLLKSATNPYSSPVLALSIQRNLYIALAGQPGELFSPLDQQNAVV
jgi:hypothetical protein